MNKSFDLFFHTFSNAVKMQKSEKVPIKREEAIYVVDDKKNSSNVSDYKRESPGQSLSSEELDEA